MKKIFVLLVSQVVIVLTLQAQKVSNYSYQFDNGITVRTEQCWNHVWVSQNYESLKASDQVPLILNVRTLGNLTSGSTFKLFSSGKEVKIQGLKPGTYTMKESFKLGGKPGVLSFQIDEVIIKPQMKTTLSIILYDYEIIIDEKQENHSGQSFYTSKIERYKGNTEQNPTCGLVTLYDKGKHETPVGTTGSAPVKNGSAKPAVYDVLITLGTPGYRQKVWLENFQMKPDVSYNISTNINAGIIEYTGSNKAVKSFHLYPAGTADRQKGNPAPDKNLEIMKCENQAVTTACPPGTYDVLLNFNNGKKYEWRKNIAVKTGSRVQVS